MFDETRHRRGYATTTLTQFLIKPVMQVWAAPLHQVAVWQYITTWM